MSDLSDQLAARLVFFPLFLGLKPESLSTFSRYAQHLTFCKGEILFLPGTANDKFFLIETGWVKIFKQTLDGTEAVTDTLTTGHWFGEVGLAGTELLPYGAEVIENASIIALPRFLLAEEVMRNGAFGLKILQGITRQKADKDMEIEHRSIQTAPQRIGCLLLKLCQTQTGSSTLSLPYDKTTMAHRLGMQPETFSRALVKLREETNLQIMGSTVNIPDIEILVRYICASCSSRFPCVN